MTSHLHRRKIQKITFEQTEKLKEQPASADVHAGHISNDPTRTTLASEDDEPQQALLDQFFSLSSVAQSLFLESLVTQLSPAMLSPLYLSMQPLLRTDFLRCLPAELSHLILERLDLESLANALMVSQTWKSVVAKDVNVWKNHWRIEMGLDASEEDQCLSIPKPALLGELLENHTTATITATTTTTTAAAAAAAATAIPTTTDQKRSSRRKSNKKPTAASSTPTPDTTSALTSASIDIPPSFSDPYDNNYMRQINQSRKLRYMWREGSPRTFSFECHAGSVITCLQLLDSTRVVSGSDDGTIRIWCTLTGKLLASCLGHAGGVWALHAMGPLLLSGSTDRTLRVWKIATGECLGILKGHGSTVRCVSLFTNEPTPASSSTYPSAVSGSRDQTLRIWDLKTLTCKHVLYGHASSVRCLAVQDKQVVSGSYDGTARLWDLESGTCLRIFLGHQNKIYSITFRDHFIATGGLDSHVFVWDARSGECIHILEGHRGLIGSLQFRKNSVISSNTDGTIKIWNLETGESVGRSRSENGSAITCLQADHQRLVAGSDKYLRLLDPETGAFVRNLITGVDTVWRVAFDENICVAACQTEGVTALYVLRFDDL